MEFLKRLISSDFLPHGTCYLWDPHIVWLHVISDSLITFAYYCIPLALVYLARKRRSCNLGTNSYIQKPVDFDRFREIVKSTGLYWLVINQRPLSNPGQTSSRAATRS